MCWLKDGGRGGEGGLNCTSFMADEALISGAQCGLNFKVFRPWWRGHGVTLSLFVFQMPWKHSLNKPFQTYSWPNLEQF